jgi:hypothetical protein
MLSLLLAALSLDPAATQELMRRVAENLEKPHPARRQFVYTVKTHTRLFRSQSKLAREEKREYRVIPQDDKVERERTLFWGQYFDGKKAIPYDNPAFRTRKMDLDGELLDDFAEDHVIDSNSRDGVDLDYFPLRSQDLEHYNFTFLGEKSLQGRPAAHIKIAPKQATWEHLWAGEALIDLEDAFPVQIQTQMNKKIPWGVRAFLGIDIKQFGFAVTFTRLEKGLWFPRTYGTEFGLRLFFAYNRTITLSAESTDFRRANADSSITFSDVPDTKP